MRAGAGDLAVIRLSDPVDDLTPARRASLDSMAGLSDIGQIVVTVGSGSSGNGLTGAAFPGTLERAGANVIDAIARTDGFGNFVPDNRYLAIDMDHPRSFASNVIGSPFPLDFEFITAPGDSGGPWYTMRPNGDLHVVGVTSYGVDWNRNTLQSDYGDVSVAARLVGYEDWIDGELGGANWLEPVSGGLSRSPPAGAMGPCRGRPTPCSSTRWVPTRSRLVATSSAHRSPAATGRRDSTSVGIGIGSPATCLFRRRGLALRASTWRDGTLEVDSHVRVEGGSTLAFANADLELPEAGLFFSGAVLVEPGADLQVRGEATIDGRLTSSGRIALVGSDATLRLAGQGLKTITSDSTVTNLLSFDRNEVVNADSSTLVIESGAEWRNLDLFNEGSLSAAGVVLGGAYSQSGVGRAGSHAQQSLQRRGVAGVGPGHPRRRIAGEPDRRPASARSIHDPLRVETVGLFRHVAD